MSTPSPQFDQDQAQYFLGEVLSIPRPTGRTTPGIMSLAYKLTTSPNPDGHEYYIPAGVRRDDNVDNYWWFEHQAPTIARALANIGARVASDPNVKVMYSPCTFDRVEGNRKLSNVFHTQVVALDYDGWKTGPMPIELKRDLKKLRPMIVRSGSPHSFHAYIGVRDVDSCHGMTLEQHDSLSRTLRNYFGFDSKGRPNDLFGLPGTINPKTGKMVQLMPMKTYDFNRNTAYPKLHFWSSIQDVADLLELKLFKGRTGIMENLHAWEVPTVDLSHVPTPTMRMLKRRVRDWYMKNGPCPDRSQANYFIVLMCMEYKLTADETYTFMTEHCDSRGYKFTDAQLAEDIHRIRAAKDAA